MRILGIVATQLYDHYLTRGVQVGMFGHDVYHRYRQWGRNRVEPMSPAKRAAFIISQVIRLCISK